jgi:hypothetical protein
MRYERDVFANPVDNRLCGFPTKSGRPCKAHAVMVGNGEIIGCYLHDPRRKRHAMPRNFRPATAAEFARLIWALTPMQTSDDIGKAVVEFGWQHPDVSFDDKQLERLRTMFHSRSRSAAIKSGLIH